MFQKRKHRDALESALSVFLLTAVLFFAALPFSDPIPTVPVSAAASAPAVVLLDAGHGGEDSGTIGKNGVYEKDLNLDVARGIGALLSSMGWEVLYTRTDDRMLYTEEENVKGLRKISDLKNRCAVAQKHPEAIFVSVHMNAYSAPSAHGFQVYYSPQGEEDRRLALAVQTSVREKLQPDNHREVKEGRSIYLLEHIENPAILIECGFLSNPEECEKLCQKEYQKELCFAIVCGMIEYNQTKK